MNQETFLDRYGNPHQKPAEREVLHRDSVYGMTIENNKILLVKAPDFDFWVIPGGGVDQGESIEEGLRREFVEETGFLIDEVGKLFFSEKMNFYAMKPDRYYHSYCKYFFVTINTKNQDLTKLNPEDAGDIRWFDLKDFDLGILNHASKKAVEKLIMECQHSGDLS